MTKTKRFLALLLTVVMLCTGSMSVSAATTSAEAWSNYWKTADEEIGAAVMLTPGSDDSERYVSWYSESESGSVVLLDSNGKKLDEFTASANKTHQDDYRLCAVIDSLEGGKTYGYYCKSGDWMSETYTFTTIDGDSFTAMYLTDIHITGEDYHEDGIRDNSYNLNLTLETGLAKARAQGKNIDLLLSAGDQGSDGRRDEYTGFVASPLVRSIPFATTVGNHDKKGADYRYFTHQPNTADMNIRSYVGTDYWFVKGDVLFLIMDSNNTSMTDHRRFVKKAVKANEDVKWRVAMFHHDLYSARIESRESENALLRLMWAPIADEFGIDLCLLGHSHYYTISNVLYNNKTVEATENGGKVTDAEGTVYMVSGSVNRPRDDEDVGLSENIGHAYLTQEKIYNLIDFSEDSIVINSYTVESDENIGSLTIEKTTNEGGHNYRTIGRLYYPLVSVIGFIANIFTNIGDAYDNRQQGFKIPLFEGLFG